MQNHAMRACSLLVIPPKEREPPPGGFPKDLSDLNLSGWAGLVQDITSGLLAPPLNLGSNVSLPAVVLFELLEKTTGWGYCRFCYHIGSRCACMGAYSPVPPPSWSQVVGESPGCRATASSGCMTTPSTTAGGMSRYLPPPPGLPPIDFSKWRLPLPEAPACRRPTAPSSLPGVRRSIRLRGMVKRIAGVPHSGRLAQQMPVPPTLMPCMPQTVPPLRQPHPEQPATPYQQAVQLPQKPVGGESFLTHPQVKLPSWVAPTQRTMEGLQREGGEMVVNPSVTQEVYQGRRVCSRHIRRAISLSGEVSQGLTSVIPHSWQQSFTAVVGGRTWSISSRSITNSTLPPLRKWNGRGSRSGSSTTSSPIRRKLWPSKKTTRWTSWPTSRIFSIRPPASIWMASGASQAGSSRGATIMG